MSALLLNSIVQLPTRYALWVAVLAFSSPLMAQETQTPAKTGTPPPSPTSRPIRRLPTYIPPAAVATSPANRPPVEASGDDDTIPLIDFPNTDIRQVLEFYETLTGKKALYDNTVQGNIHVRVTKPVARAEAIRILETVFALNNFTLIPGSGDIVKVIFTSKNVRQFDIPIFSEIDQLPVGNQVVSFLFKLEYADPQEVKTALDSVIASTTALTSIVALPKSQAVLVTERSDLIRNVAQIVAKLDRKPAEVVSEFFALQRADAKEVVEKLGKMFEKGENKNSSAPAPNPPGVPGGAQGNSLPIGGSITLSEDSLIVGKIKIEADLRTNRVHVVTRPVNLPFLRTLIGELDSGLPLGEPATRPLRFVLAGDILDVVAGAVAEPGVEVKKLENAGKSPGAANPVSNSTGNLGNYNGSGNRSSSNTRGSSGITAGSFGGNRMTAQADTAPEGRIIRNTKIIADNRTNAIIVVGNAEMKAKVFNLLDQIDVRAPQVMLTAVIGELTLNNDEEFGVDYLLHKGNLSQLINTSGSLGLPWAVPGITGSNLKNIVSAASLPSTGGGVTGLIGATNTLDLFVTALESTGRFRVTSRPMIFTSNNRPAIISSGESIAVPSTINSSYGYGSGNSLVSTASVDYIDVALKLSVLPLINSEGEVTLQISQEANNTSGSTVISGNSIPTVTTRSIDTTVSVANEATVVLGGLVSEQKHTTNSGIPVLHRLPLVGPLFGYKKISATRTELVVLIRPTVTSGPVEAVKAGERAMQKTNFQPDLDASLDPAGARVKQENKTFAFPQALLRDE